MTVSTIATSGPAPDDDEPVPGPGRAPRPAVPAPPAQDPTDATATGPATHPIPVPTGTGSEPSRTRRTIRRPRRIVSGTADPVARDERSGRLRLLRDDSGMSTVEYAIGTVAAAAFAAILYAVVTSYQYRLSAWPPPPLPAAPPCTGARPTTRAKVAP